jgi:hypothetical protein
MAKIPRPKPGDLGLEARFNLEWKINDIADAGFQAAVDTVEEILLDAKAQAQDNVAPGHGPGPHPHRAEHGFSWIDTGDLAREIDYDMSAERNANGKWVGVPEGTLIVNPIDTDRGPIPYGAYLEMGFVPIIQTPLGPRRSTGFFRYPFLAPALYMATARLADRAGIRLRDALIDRERAARKTAAVFKSVEIDDQTGYRIGRFADGSLGQLPDPVQALRNLDTKP